MSGVIYRVIDRGALVGAAVGMGMAATLAVSLLLIIPIEPAYWYLTLPLGLLIGWYANQRSNRIAGPWPRIGANGLFAGAVAGASMAVFLLVVKGLFFVADDGYRDPEAGGRLSCVPGAECVFMRYQAVDSSGALAAAGATDAASFSRFYWNRQLSTAGLVVVIGAVGGIGGAAIYGLRRPKAAGAMTAAT
ncbi:MAG TPA: hypothetical protein VIM30_06070 [Candidatus Limnocylindrales bacterium]